MFHVFDRVDPELFRHFGIASIRDASQLSAMTFEQGRDYFEVQVDGIAQVNCPNIR